jgi:hypothetical protein
VAALLQLVPAHAVEQQQHDAIGLDRGGGQPRRRLEARLEQGGHDVADAGTLVVGHHGFVHVDPSLDHRRSTVSPLP